MNPKFALVLAFISTFNLGLAAEPVNSVEGVKSYLVGTVEKMQGAAHEFQKNAASYAKIIDAARGDYRKAFSAHPKEIAVLIHALQDNYKAMDSYGYETIEGIVAGVGSLEKYDIYLDAGVPQAEGAESVSPLVLALRNGEKIDRQGSLFTYIIEPALWSGDTRWIVPVDLNGDGKIEAREALPKVEIVLAAGDDVDRQIDSLLYDAKAWTPSAEDCLGAMVKMTPTLSDYFEDWKESRYSDKQSGRFYAVSRVSDMRGIMASCSVMYQAVHADLEKKDPALAKSIKTGFDQILAFLDKVDAREKVARKVSLAEIDELASQAKSKTDKLVPQIEQAGVLVKKG
jgi:hypothetical protein